MIYQSVRQSSTAVKPRAVNGTTTMQMFCLCQLPIWISSPRSQWSGACERVEHGIFGYGAPMPVFYDIILSHLKARYDWAVDAEDVAAYPVVRAYKRGEDFDSIFERIALAPDSRQEAEEMYKRLASAGI